MSGREVQATALKGQALYRQHHRFAFACEQVAGLKVLDLACGQGEGSAMLAAFAAEVSAIDIDSDAIALARTLYKNLGSVSFQVGDIRHLPFEDGLFDAVVSFGPLDQTGNPEGLIKEARRVLKPDGLLIASLTTPHGNATSEDGPDAPSDATNTEAWTERLSRGFSNLAIYGQRMVSASAISPVKTTPTAPNVAEYRAYRTTNHEGARPKASAGVVRFSDPTHLVFVASDAPIPHVSGPDSMFLMDSIDLWAMRSEDNHHPVGEHGAVASLTHELQQARNRIEALVEARDSLERAVAGQDQAQRGNGATDISVIGPMMEELAGRPIPADVPNLVRLLGQIAVRSAQLDIRLSDMERLQLRSDALQVDLDRQTNLTREAVAQHEAATILSHKNAEAASLAAERLSQAYEDIATLTKTKQALISDLDDIGSNAEAQAKLLQDTAAAAQENAAVFANQANQQSALLTEILQDMAQTADREQATNQANLALIAERDDLRAQLELSRRAAAERHDLGVQLAELEQSLSSSQAARCAVENSLIDLTTLKQADEHQHAVALASLTESMAQEHTRQLAELERSLTSSEASKRIAEEKLAEIVDLKQVAENQIEALRNDLNRAAEREAAAQVEILSRTFTEDQLTQACRQSTIELTAAHDTVSRQAEEISNLVNAGRQASADFEASQQALGQQSVKMSEIETVSATYQGDLQTANNTIQALNARVSEMASIELALRTEHETRKAEQEHWKAERDAWASERKALRNEADQWARERDGLRFELEAVATQRHAWETEMHAWHAEKQALNAELDAHHAERESWSDERNNLTLALAEASQKLSDQAALLQPTAWWTRLSSLTRK